MVGGEVTGGENDRKWDESISLGKSVRQLVKSHLTYLGVPERWNMMTVIIREIEDLNYALCANDERVCINEIKN